MKGANTPSPKTPTGTRASDHGGVGLPGGVETVDLEAL